MSLELFPLDSQICHITLASYGWTDDDVKYNWKVRLAVTLNSNCSNVKMNPIQSEDPVYIQPGIFLPGGFELSRHIATKVKHQHSPMRG